MQADIDLLARHFRGEETHLHIGCLVLGVKPRTFRHEARDLLAKVGHTGTFQGADHEGVAEVIGLVETARDFEQHFMAQQVNLVERKQRLRAIGFQAVDDAGSHRRCGQGGHRRGGW